ncbi:HCCA isomerase/glutathione S-transferase kappa [Venturia nashicola]|uniref:Glutathione S-transferase kappa n=1 Tax=Venturia nashicola TaxID=86259 RepID=A0A4Z1PIS1_9PEZI|nr:HCCA isomerase/glutathione S-transferase kappa [Venturia nashicola]
MSKPSITLFVDTVSPFAYLAYYALRNFPVFKQCEITYVPILLGGLMKLCNNTPPLEIKNKSHWIGLERLRWARKFNIPMHEEVPGGFPIATLGTQRVLCALALEQPDAVTRVIDVLYHEFFVNHQMLNKPEVVATLIAKALGISYEDAKTWYDKGNSSEAKALLMQNTKMAFDEGAFGLPWFIATNASGDRESFWGFDHLGQVADHLGLERSTANGWRAML